MIVKIVPNDRGDPPNKLADVELLFEEGALSGMRLIGFGIWQRRGGGQRTVTVPSRSFFVRGESRSYALLRPISDKIDAAAPLRELILRSYEDFERRQATAT